MEGEGEEREEGKCGGENHEDSTVHHPALLTPVYTLLHVMDTPFIRDNNHTKTHVYITLLIC